MNAKPRTLALVLPLLGGVILLAGLFALFAAPPAAADAAIRYVAPGGDCGGASPCYATLQAAVDDAASGDEIRVAQGTYTGVSTHSGKTALVYIETHLTLRGGYTTADWEHPDPEAHPTVLDAQGQGMVIYINRVTGTFIEGFHITGGYASEAVSGEEWGAGIHAMFSDWVAIQNCEVYSNTNDGIYLEFGDGATIQNNRVHDNIGKGIGVFTSQRQVTISHNQVTNNSGSGIYVNSIIDPMFGLRLAYILDNTVTGNGRGLYLSSADGVVSGNQILSNTVDADFYITAGGGILIRFSSLDIHDNEIRGNHSHRGGGISIEGCHDTVIEDNRIEDNHADLYWDSEGGGLYIETKGDVTIRNNTILSNTGGRGAGGAYVLSQNAVPEDILIQGNIFSGNHGDMGGGLYVNTGTVANNRFLDNQARLGGGLYTQPYSLTLRNNLFQDNQAGEDGGGICIYFGTVVWMEGNRLIGNQAGGNGGGLRFHFQKPALDATANLLMTNTLVVDNVAAHGSGLYVYGGRVALKHTTLAHNGVAGSGDGVGLYVKPFGVVSTTLTNTIVASQTVGVYAEPNAPVSLRATLWGDGAWDNGADWGGGGQIVTGTLNYWGDPLFVDPASGDYHISAASPARDKGVDVGVTRDMDGEIRPHPDTGIPDLGADEYHLDDIRIYLPLVMR